MLSFSWMHDEPSPMIAMLRDCSDCLEYWRGENWHICSFAAARTRRSSRLMFVFELRRGCSTYGAVANADFAWSNIRDADSA